MNARRILVYIQNEPSEKNERKRHFKKPNKFIFLCFSIYFLFSSLYFNKLMSMYSVKVIRADSAIPTYPILSINIYEYNILKYYFT